LHDAAATDSIDVPRRLLLAILPAVIGGVVLGGLQETFGNLAGPVRGYDADEIIAKHTDKTPAGEPDDGKILLRVFCHAHGNRLILLLGGYDKEADPSDKRQDKEIKLARKRLTEYKGR